MRPEVLLPLAILFIAHSVPSNAQSEGEVAATSAAPERAAEREAGPVFYYDVKHPFSLNCTLPRADAADAYVWKVNDTALADVTALKGRHELQQGQSVLKVTGRTVEDDFGIYSCAVGGAVQSWDVRGRPHGSLPPNTNVVEGQKFKLVCKVTGKPYPAVVWTYNATESNSTDALALLGARARVERSEQGVEGAALVVEVAARTDAGAYTCAPALAGAAPDTTVLRVKDKYAALWPFLGICAEVFVLCAIILVYEKRRTKPELDDSDTDNHDQKKS